MELIYETHSTTVDNERGIASGWLDGELSEHGREQTRRLGERRRDADVVYVSDLGRAVETAERRSRSSSRLRSSGRRAGASR